jgi:hypothetical protein
MFKIPDPSRLCLCRSFNGIKGIDKKHIQARTLKRVANYSKFFGGIPEFPEKSRVQNNPVLENFRKTPFDELVGLVSCDFMKYTAKFYNVINRAKFIHLE